MTAEFVLWDRDGKRRSELLSLEAQIHSNLSLERDIRALERQLRWYQGLCPWDISHAELRRALREQLELDQFLDPAREWTEYDLQACAERARGLAKQIQVALNFTIPTDSKANGKPRMSDVQIVHQLLSQLGLKVSFRWSRAVPGHEGKKLRVYRLDAIHWQTLTAILERRQQRRESQEQKGIEAAAGSPPPLEKQISQGDPAINNDLAIWQESREGTEVAEAIVSLESLERRPKRT